MYKLLKVYPVDDDDEDDDVFACEIFTIGLDSAWRNIGRGPSKLRDLLSESVCFDGVLYWRVVEDGEDGDFGGVFAFHLVEEKFQLLLSPPEDDDFIWFHLPIFGRSLSLISLEWFPSFTEA